MNTRTSRPVDQKKVFQGPSIRMTINGNAARRNAMFFATKLQVVKDIQYWKYEKTN